MSYTILYRAMFIKLSDGSYIPMIESGDNNVWEVERNRRSREWDSCRWVHETEEQRRRYSLTEKEIMDAAQREVDRTLERYVGREPAFGGAPYTREDVLNDLGFFNGIKVSGHRTTSASQFLGMFRAGLRNAVTMDDLLSGLRLSWYEDGGNNWCTDTARNEEELSQKWQEYLSKGITPWIGLSKSTGDYAWLLVKSRKPKVERKKPEGNFVIAFDYGGVQKFVVKLTSRNLKYNPWKDCAYKYSSKKLAENAVKRIAERFNQLSNVRVVSL